MKPNPDDWNESVELISEIEKHFGGSQPAMAFLLMSIGNLTKHLAKNISREKFDDIFRDDVIAGIGSSYALRFMKVGDVLLKKYGIRK